MIKQLYFLKNSSWATPISLPKYLKTRRFTKGYLHSSYSSVCQNLHGPPPASDACLNDNHGSQQNWQSISRGSNDSNVSHVWKWRSNFKMVVLFFQVIQIMVGLMHLGFGIILCLIVIPYGRVLGFASAVISGYPFWGGLSVSRLLEHHSFLVYKVLISPANSQLISW